MFDNLNYAFGFLGAFVSLVLAVVELRKEKRAAWKVIAVSFLFVLSLSQVYFTYLSDKEASEATYEGLAQRYDISKGDGSVIISGNLVANQKTNLPSKLCVEIKTDVRYDVNTIVFGNDGATSANDYVDSQGHLCIKDPSLGVYYEIPLATTPKTFEINPI